MNRIEQIRRLQQLRSNFEGLLQDAQDSHDIPNDEFGFDFVADAYQRLSSWLCEHADEFPPSPPRHRTRDEIEALKAEWLADRDASTWNIEDTPGYECHSPELLAFRLQTELEEIVKEFIRTSDAVWQFDASYKDAQASCAMRLAVFIRRNIKRLEVKP